MKKRNVIFTILLASLLITGCNGTKEDNLTITEIDPESIVSTIRYEACFTTSYSDFAEMAEASSVIVYGEITGIDYYMNMNGACATRIDVNVIQSLKGSVEEGDTIQIEEDQGIVTLKEYIDSYETEELRETIRNDYQQYSDDELDNIYVKQLLFGDIMFEVGQKNVFLLTGSNNYDTRHTYSRINGPFGSFTELSDNCFYWTQGIGSSLAEENGINLLDASADSERVIESVKPNTLDELISDMDL